MSPERARGFDQQRPAGLSRDCVAVSGSIRPSALLLYGFRPPSDPPGEGRRGNYSAQKLLVVLDAYASRVGANLRRKREERFVAPLTYESEGNATVLLENDMQTVTVSEVIVFFLSMGVILYLWML